MTLPKSSTRKIKENGRGPSVAPQPANQASPVAQNDGLANQESNEKDNAYTTLKVMFGLLGPFRLEYLGILFVMSVLAATEGILQPLLVKFIFDEGVIKNDFGRFITLAGAYMAFGLAINLIGTGASIWNKSFDNRIIKTMGKRLLESYYEKQYVSILQNGDGYFINRIYGDVREGLIPLSSLILSIVSQTVLLVSFSVVLTYLSWQAFLCLVAIIPFSTFVSAKLGKQIKPLTAQEREQEGAVLAILTKALGAFRIVKMFNLLSPTLGIFNGRLDEYLATNYKRYKVTRAYQALNSSTMVISDFLSMFVGALFVIRGALTFGGYLAFINTFWRAVTTLMQVFNQLASFHAYGVITRRVASSLSSPLTKYYQQGRSTSVNKVEFSYADTPILQDFSLQLSPGERVVIVGPNGCGKTTLANILSGHLAPSQGEVVLPERISSVTLPISFPPLKVKNLISDTHLLSAFRLNDETLLEAFADELSAGQQQKLAISLVLSQEADLYVIDEPLATLDQESKDIAINLIIERTKEKTLILVMHGSEEYHPLFDRVIRIDEASKNGEKARNSLAVGQL